MELISDAVAEGYGWVGALATAWSEDRFLGPGVGLFVAYHNDEPFGIAAVTRDPRASDDRTGRLRFVYVAESARGAGVAQALLDACLSRATERWSLLRLHTDNPIAARMYEARGFVRAEADPTTTHVLPIQQ